MFDLTALGEILIDFTIQGRNSQGQRIFAQNAGGAPANVAAAAAKLGAKTSFIGKAGNDMHGRFLKDTLNECGVDSTGLILSDEYFTTLAFVNVGDDGEREFSFARSHGADKMLGVKDIPQRLIMESRILHIGSISLTDEPCRGATIYAIEQVKNSGGIISYDPNYRASLWSDEETAKAQMRDAVKYVDIMKISDEETELLTDEADYEKAAEMLVSRGVKIVCVTLGKAGAYVRTNAGGKFVRGFKNKAVDATGAGDAFWGGFLYSLIKSKKRPDQITLSEAAEFADFGNAAASVCVENYGAIPALPNMEQVREKLNKAKD